MKNIIVIHIALMDRWSERLDMFLSLIYKSKLLFEKIYLCFVGDAPINITENDKIVIKILSTDLKSYELPTQKLLYDFCCENNDYNVLYLHTKGVGQEINFCIEDWVNYMLYFLVEKNIDVNNKLSDYDTVGVDLRQEPSLHYSGNFWWAKSSYISSLPDPLSFKDLNKYPNPLNSERHNQEFWICYNKGKHFCLWDCGIDCYERHLHRYLPDKYRLS